MAKRKFETKEYYEKLIEDYIKENKAAIINYTLKQMGYDDVDILLEDEYHSKWGNDCGWYLLYPKNREMREEWKKHEDWEKLMCPLALGVQSTTIQKYQVEYIMNELNLNDIFYCNRHLD